MMDDFVARTPMNEKDNLDEQLSRFIISAYCSFNLVENKEFKKFCTSLQPGYKAPSHIDVADKRLPKIYSDEIMKHEVDLENETICMAMDEWSNIAEISSFIALDILNCMNFLGLVVYICYYFTENQQN